jgi:hypothetical protein
MRPRKVGPSTLLLMATAAVLALMVASELHPAQLSSIRDLDGEGEVAVVVVRCRPCTGGYLLNLTDGLGTWADAFCPSEVCPTPLANGTSVRAEVQRSPDDPNFLYVQKLTRVSAPTVNI